MPGNDDTTSEPPYPKSDVERIREYLERHARRFGRLSLAAFVLEHGQVFETDAKTFVGRRMTPKQCFGNATKVALRRPDMVYVEGFVQSSILIHHAWLMRPDGKVFDPTFRGDDDPLRGYFGVAFSTGYVVKATFPNGVYNRIDLIGRTVGEVAAREGASHAVYASAPSPPCRGREIIRTGDRRIHWSRVSCSC